MPLVPSSISRLISNLRTTTTASNNSTVTLFDDLSPSEKVAAIQKLEELAGQQPHQPPKARTFNWKIFSMVFLGLSFVVCAIIASVAIAIDVDADPSLVAKLRMANTNLDRMKLLPKDSDWLFDFTKQKKYTFSPGGVVNANAATFPATVGQGLTMAMLNLGPCSMLPPHIHPRATNFVVAISGTTSTYMIAENGAQTIHEILTPGKMTIFPTGSVHTMINLGCDNAQLVSALSSDDAGTHNLANAFFSLPSNITSTVLGGGVNIGATQASILGVGTGSIAGPEQCIAACAAKGKKIRRTTGWAA